MVSLEICCTSSTQTKAIVSCCPDLDLATGIANTAGLVLHRERQIRCCHAVSGADTFVDHNKPSSSGNNQILCLNLLAKQGPHSNLLHTSIIAPYVCVLCTERLWSWFQRDSMRFTWQSTVNGHRSERVCGSRGASSRTGPVYRETFWHSGAPFLS